MKHLISFAFLFSSLTLAAGDFDVVVGKLIKQEHIPGVQPAECFEDNVLCMNVYIRYDIDVNNVLVGDNHSGVISAARYQHSELAYHGSEVAAFVIRRIKNAKTRRLLKVDYFLEDHVQIERQYCFGSELKEYTSKLGLDNLNSRGCMYENALKQDFKNEAISNLIYQFEERLEADKVLIDLYEGSSYEPEYGGESLTEAEEELVSDECYPFPNRDQEVTHPICERELNTKYYEVADFKLKKGHAANLINEIQESLKATRLNLDNVYSEFKIVQEKDFDRLLWQYYVTPVE